MKILSVLIIGALALYSCNNATTAVKTAENNMEVSTVDAHAVTVLEVIQTTAYTYLKVDENGLENWIAVTKIEANIGDKFYYSGGDEMKNFESKELNRVFSSVYFVQNISKTQNQGESTATKSESKVATMEKVEAIEIDPVEGGISIGDLYKNKEDYVGKSVIIKAKVTKVNKNIMDRNWIHLQDGTADGGNFDLTITTNQIANVGDIITIEGIVTLNKDFGAGYFYELILENAILK